jgi:hypothetical protein
MNKAGKCENAYSLRSDGLAKLRREVWGPKRFHEVLASLVRGWIGGVSLRRG